MTPEYILELVKSAELPEGFEYPFIEDGGVLFDFDDESELTMDMMVVLIEFCKTHGLTFEVYSRHSETTRAGYLAYDSMIFDYTIIAIKENNK